jgi:hypothetical protein
MTPQEAIFGPGSNHPRCQGMFLGLPNDFPGRQGARGA